jgi:hypothetical protein
MVAILLILVVLSAIAVMAGVSSRRRAAERAGVDRERRIIAGQLGDRR